MRIVKICVGIAFLCAFTGVLSLFAAGLPAEYTPVEFVETEGNQYIDTEYYPGPNTIFEGDVLMAGKFVSSDNGTMFGADGFAANFANNNSDRILVWCGPSGMGVNDVYGANAYNGERVKLGFDSTTATFTYGGVTRQDCRVPVATLALPFCIGGYAKQAGQSPTVSPFKCFRMRIYGWKIWTGDTLERDYVPCVRNADDVPGLYDLQTGVFKPSAGDPFVVSGQKSILEFPDTGDSRSCVTFDYYPSISNLTASAWVKNVTAGTSGFGADRMGCIMAQGGLSGVCPGFVCYVKSPDQGATCSLVYQLRTSQKTVEISIDWTSLSKDDRWHLVTITHDQRTGACGLYVDAELKACSTNSTTAALSKAPFVIGGRSTTSPGDAQFMVKGCVAEVSLWDRVLRPRELRRQLHGPLSGTEQGLLGYWPLNDNGFGSNVATDCVNNGNTPHPGTVGNLVNVFFGSVEFLPAPGLSLILR